MKVTIAGESGLQVRLMMSGVKNFFTDEAGVAVVDWVALVASTIVLGIAVTYALFNTGVANLTGHVNTTLSAGVGSIDTGNVDNLVAQNQGSGG